MSSSSNSTTIENQEQQYGPFSRMATTMTDPRNQTKNQRQKGWGWQCYGWIPGEPRDPRVWWNQTHQRVVITTVGYRGYLFLAGYRWHPRDRKNYKRLMRTIQNVHGDGDNGDVRAENTFDIMLEVRFPQAAITYSRHFGSHVIVLERVIAHRDFPAWPHNVIRLYNHTDPNKPVIKILITDPDGDKTAVACAIILQYCLNLLGFEAGTCGFIRHLSKDHFWKKHCRRCINCRYPEQQPRFKEVMDVAARRLFAMMQ